MIKNQPTSALELAVYESAARGGPLLTYKCLAGRHLAHMFVPSSSGGARDHHSNPRQVIDLGKRVVGVAIALRRRP